MAAVMVVTRPIAVLIAIGFALSADAESTLRVGLTAAPPSKGNPYQNLGTTSNFVWPAFYDTLTYRDNDGMVRPASPLIGSRTVPQRGRFICGRTHTFPTVSP